MCLCVVCLFCFISTTEYNFCKGRIQWVTTFSDLSKSVRNTRGSSFSKLSFRNFKTVALNLPKKKGSEPHVYASSIVDSLNPVTDDTVDRYQLFTTVEQYFTGSRVGIIAELHSRDFHTSRRMRN